MLIICKSYLLTLETVEKATQFYYILEDCSLALTLATESASIYTRSVFKSTELKENPIWSWIYFFCPMMMMVKKGSKADYPSLCSRALKSLKRRLPSLSTYIVEMIHFRLMQFFCAEKGAYLLMDSLHTWKLSFRY